jgi:hypothetical protein
MRPLSPKAITDGFVFAEKSRKDWLKLAESQYRLFS